MQVIWKTDGLTIWITDASYMHHTTYTTTVLRPFYQDHPGEPVPEENFWTLCKGLTYVNDARSNFQHEQANQKIADFAPARSATL